MTLKSKRAAPYWGFFFFFAALSFVEVAEKDSNITILRDNARGTAVELVGAVITAGEDMERLHDDALLAVLARISFTWYGELRATCRRLQNALSREIWAARRAAGIEESTFVLMVRPEMRDGSIPGFHDPNFVPRVNPGFDNAFFVPRVGGGWVQLPSPKTIPENYSVTPDEINGSLYLNLMNNEDPQPMEPIKMCLRWSRESWEWQVEKETPSSWLPEWATSVDYPSFPSGKRGATFFPYDRHCYIGIFGNERQYARGQCPADEKTRLYVLYRGDQSWTRLADPPNPWVLLNTRKLPGRLLCQDATMHSLIVTPQMEKWWVYTLADNRWDRIENPLGATSNGTAMYDGIAMYDQGFIVYPDNVGTALDMPIYHGTFGAVNDDDKKPKITYTSLPTPATVVARAWAQAAGFEIPLRDGVVAHLPDDTESRTTSRRELGILISSPIRF